MEWLLFFFLLVVGFIACFVFCVFVAANAGDKIEQITNWLWNKLEIKKK